MSYDKSEIQKWAEKFAKDYALSGRPIVAASFRVGDLVSIDGVLGQYRIVRFGPGDGFVVSDITDGTERFVRESDCQQLTQPISSGFYGNSGGYNIASMPIYWDKSAPWPSTILTKEHGIIPDRPKAPECECGSHKTYGTNCSSDMHSTWCKLYGKA